MANLKIININLTLGITPCATILLVLLWMIVRPPASQNRKKTTLAQSNIKFERKNWTLALWSSSIIMWLVIMPKFKLFSSIDDGNLIFIPSWRTTIQYCAEIAQYELQHSHVIKLSIWTFSYHKIKHIFIIIDIVFSWMLVLHLLGFNLMLLLLDLQMLSVS
jgi:hypothetical protein